MRKRKKETLRAVELKKRLWRNMRKCVGDGQRDRWR